MTREETVKSTAIILTGVLGSWSLQDFNHLVAIFSGVVAICYGLLKCFQLVWELWIAESIRRKQREKE